MTRAEGDAPLIAIRGEQVTELRFDYGFTVIAEASEARIESRFEVARNGEVSVTVDPATPSHAEELLELHQTTLDADCHADGTLEMRFSNGWVLRVTPDIDYEAWTITLRTGELVAALPGGGVASFGPRSAD